MYDLTLEKTQLSKLVSITSPSVIINEVATILGSDLGVESLASLMKAYKTTLRIYNGKYPGYQACNTMYHDLTHAVSTFLAMARLIHGYLCDGEKLSSREILVGLVAAILHDSGFIQKDEEKGGTGAKYSDQHVMRSIEMLKLLGPSFGLGSEEVSAGRDIILGTEMTLDFHSIRYSSEAYLMLGRMLAAVDLLAQISDRWYLEKLSFLYEEYKEGDIGDFKDPTALLNSTGDYFEVVEERLQKTLGGVQKYMKPHFLNRWEVDRDPYEETIKAQKIFLADILKKGFADPFSYLKRKNSARKSLNS